MGAGDDQLDGPDRLVRASIVFAHTMLEHLASCAAEVGLPKQQAYALHLLAREPGLSMSALGERLGADPSTVSGLVDRLEARGLIERHHISADRRVKVLSMTELGLERDAQVEVLIHQRAPGRTVLSAEEQRTLAELLERVVGSGPEPCRHPTR
jgi:DNA-binding MarR family transcriptional regulator